MSWEQAILLQEELARVREEKIKLKLERDKNLCLWEITKRSLREAESKLRRTIWEKEEAKERHRKEISSYELKRRHAELEQHNTITKLNMDSVTAALEIQNQHLPSVLELRRRIQDLKAEHWEKITHNEMRLKKLKLEQQMEIVELNKGYEYTLQEMGRIYNEKMSSMIAKEEKKTREALEEMDDRMRLCMLEVEKENEQKQQCASEYEPILLKLTKLKEEEQRVQDQNESLDRRLSAAKQEHEHLTERVRDIRLKDPELQKQLKELQAKEAISRARGKSIDKEIRDQTVRNELLQQAVEKAQLERDELLKSQQSQMLQLHEHFTLKEIVLRKKITSLTHTLHELQLELRGAARAAAAAGLPETV